MTIDLTGLSSATSTTTRSKLDNLEQSPSGKNQTGDSDSSATSDTVQLSTTALSLQKLEEQVGQLPDVDADRVSAIKAAIEEGSYTVDAEKLAENILSFEEELFG